MPVQRLGEIVAHLGGAAGAGVREDAHRHGRLVGFCATAFASSFGRHRHPSRRIGRVEPTSRPSPDASVGDPIDRLHCFLAAAVLRSMPFTPHCFGHCILCRPAACRSCAGASALPWPSPLPSPGRGLRPALPPFVARHAPGTGGIVGFAIAQQRCPRHRVLHVPLVVVLRSTSCAVQALRSSGCLAAPRSGDLLVRRGMCRRADLPGNLRQKQQPSPLQADVAA